MRIKVPHDVMPNFERLARIECEALVARTWEMDGRSGTSLSATAIRAAERPANGAGGKQAARAALEATS